MPHPIQPMELDAHGKLRFKRNELARTLINTHPSIDWNGLANMGFSVDDRRQLYQLFGYSVDGYCMLSINCGDANHLEEVRALEKQTRAALGLSIDNG